jgi:hypothetical protein
MQFTRKMPAFLFLHVYPAARKIPQPPMSLLQISLGLLSLGDILSSTNQTGDMSGFVNPDGANCSYIPDRAGLRFYSILVLERLSGGFCPSVRLQNVLAIFWKN